MGRAAAKEDLIAGEPLRRLHLPSADDGFIVNERDGKFLIAPAKVGRRFASDWTDDERWFRSVIVDANGRILSVGFPKFFNVGEHEGDTEILAAALATGEEVRLTEKVDGSLAIRSVIDGEVVFRTRATFDGGPHGKAMRAIAASDYPALLDPEFMKHSSLLFEFVSPSFRIVVAYERPDLVLIGAVDHASLRLATYAELQELAAANGLHLVESHPVPTSLEELTETIGQVVGREGVVAYCNSGQTLLKIKSADYLTRHRVRFYLTARAVKETCIKHDVRSMHDFERWLAGVGGDWELARDAEPFVNAYLRARAEVDSTLARLQVEVNEKKKQLPERKSFAVEYALKLPTDQRAAAFSLLDSDVAGAEKPLMKAALERHYSALEAADEENEALLDAE